MSDLSQIQRLTQAILDFRDARDWKQYHHPRELAQSLSVEAAEVLELFLWGRDGTADRERLADELADVLYAALLMAADCGFDVETIVRNKLKKNEAKYPVEQARGSNQKYHAYRDGQTEEAD